MTEASTPKTNDESAAAAAAAERNQSRVIRSEELFAGERVVLIQHSGEQYRLLITRNDRLILQK